MITIIHGTNQSATRNQLQLIKKQYNETVSLEGKNLTYDILFQNLEPISLFGEKRLVIVENLFAGKADRKDIINYLQAENFTGEVVFWEANERKTKDIITLSSKAKLIKLNIPSVIFKFLDNLTVYLLIKTLEEVEPEMILFMLIKQFRYLILCKQDGTNLPEDYKRLSSWQTDKLTKQAASFTLDKLINIYAKLQDIDYRNKSGLTGIKLEEQLKSLLLLEI